MGIRQYLPHLLGEKSETREWIDEFNRKGYEKLNDLLEGKGMKSAVFTRDVHDKQNSCAYGEGRIITISDAAFARFNKRHPGALKWQQQYKAEKSEKEEVVASRQDGVPGAPPRKMTKKLSIGKGKK